MNLKKLLGLKRTRKYPIKRDWYGRSLRQRCFELFDEGKRPVQVAAELRANKKTVFRYYRQWKKMGPNFEKQLAYVKGLLDKNSPDRDRMLEFFADTAGITVEELLVILSTPHGLRRILTRTMPLPVHKDIAEKRVMALDIAMVVQDHLLNHRGQYEDVLFALNHLMKQNQKHRIKIDADIESQNLEIELFRKLDELVFEERQKRTQPDPLLIRRAQTEINQILAAKLEEAKSSYWWRKAELVKEGLTPEQAREKLTELLTDGYDMNRTQTMKAFQDKIDPI
ncbi:MAG TPA: hypothetical protein G4O15_09625 [Dehalococcoidia bacterium]|nr:hypothetical protein [Dehalococcoidia bacterium]